jgi:hypothetical protein
LAGLTRNPDLESLIEQSDEFVMRRNATIALANIGTREAMDILQHYKDIDTGQLGEYIAWAIDRIERRTGKHNKPDTGDACRAG